MVSLELGLLKPERGKTSLMEESRARLINYWLKTALKVVFE